MGLFGESFEQKVAAAIEKIRAMNLGVKHIDAKIEGKVVTLTGEVPSKDVKGRVVQEFNKLVETENTLNQIRVAEKAPAPTPAAAPAPAAAAAKAPAAAPVAAPAAPKERIHEVVKGDTLSKIAKQYYGDANKYRKIFDANRDILDNPDLIKVGQKLRIPE